MTLSSNYLKMDVFAPWCSHTTPQLLLEGPFTTNLDIENPFYSPSHFMSKIAWASTRQICYQHNTQSIQMLSYCDWLETHYMSPWYLHNPKPAKGYVLIMIGKSQEYGSLQNSTCYQHNTQRHIACQHDTCITLKDMFWLWLVKAKNMVHLNKVQRQDLLQ